MNYLLDTNIVSSFLKKKVVIDKKLEQVRRLGQQVFISCITYYEIRRGLVYINATRQIAEFEQFCKRYKVLLLDDIKIIERAIRIHVDLQSRGLSLEDADILIAATAITRGLILVSHDSDMQRVPGITLEDWLQTES
ncbi:type II toxin-antitoxin system VapC family toxin [Scytonema sp. NUACC26]|uniref:type II toxin-antitoxin system VapC family toxin n=1 Tax=Scytonema sp. NUACC26 TaxID=3140176 RepID=UPI0034DBC46C